MKNLMKLDLQHFAEPAGGTEPPAGGQQQTQTPPAQQTQELAIDYEKLAQIVQGKQSVAEDSALRGYLKQQGLSKEQMDQAIATYKQQQAANQPDVGALQTQAAQAQAATQQAQIQAAATIAAVGLGIDAKTIPYVLKMADLSQVMGEDGEINDEALKTALNKVLEDVPALKPAPAGQAGFVQVGASGGSSQQQTTDDALKKAFGL
ncbi:MAG: hypothetical protein E7J97_24005 [Citrobacter sp.]|jgi:hypothetical protein|uniref:hypothetical protein n=1 Tax=Veillonella parvula TaxID=29466 RepID=UPI00290FBB35|nr:hypothetical protein [Veillonella parvula]MDU5166099.1 hypothetical protein [Veillonella parvula]MDU7723742.1 hypothetical protein [Citrobacter sp.]